MTQIELAAGELAKEAGRSYADAEEVVRFVVRSLIASSDNPALRAGLQSVLDGGKARIRAA